MKKSVLVFFLGFFTATAISSAVGYSYYQQWRETERNVGVSNLLLEYFSAIDTTHKFNIDEIPAIRESNEEAVPWRAIAMQKWLDEEDIPERWIEGMKMYLVLTSVMNEKIHIESWAQNAEFQDLLRRVQMENPTQVDEFRCRNWSKPMWLDHGCKEGTD